MAGLTNIKQKSVKIYDLLTKNSQLKLMGLNNKLGIDKFVFLQKNKYKITFYDTPDNLLTKTGILIYRTIENNHTFLKVEKLSFLPSVSKMVNNDYFEISVGEKDTPKTQSFYLINGITQMFSTQFFIDIENVIKSVVPKLEVDIKGNCYKGFRGDGFKFLIEFQKVVYKNFVTKRKYKNDECTVTHNAGKSFDKEFDEFIFNLEKYCKEIFLQKETRFDIGMRVTKPIIPKPKETKVKKQQNKENKKKEQKLENKIEG